MPAVIEPKRILCPVDFSACSRRALDRALGVARCYGSTVTALHVAAAVPVAARAPYWSEMPPGMTLPPIDRHLVAAELERFVEPEKAAGVRIETLVEESPAVYQEILVQADRLGADLLVMGTHGRSGFERLFLGSTTEKVLRTARCPVMTVPPAAPDAVARGPVPFTRILAAVDFSECSKAALDYAMSLAVKSKATLEVVHVIETHPLYYDFSPPAVFDPTAWNEEALSRLRQLVPDSVRGACTVTAVVRDGTPYRELLTRAADFDADLIVLGVRGRGAADLFFFGSTTNHIVRDARCAVLTLRG